MPDLQRVLDQIVALAGAGVGYAVDGPVVAVLLAGFAALVISAARTAGPQIGDAIGRAAGYWILRIARVPDRERPDATSDSTSSANGTRAESSRRLAPPQHEALLKLGDELPDALATDAKRRL